MRRILVIDDNESMLDSLRVYLSGAGYDVDCESDPRQGLERFGSSSYDVVVSDLKMPGMSGIELLSELRKVDDQVPVILITAHGTVSNAVEAMRQGAYHFIQKPIDPEVLEAEVERALAHRLLVTENAWLRAELRDRRGSRALVGHSDAMERLREMVRKVASSPATVLVAGESGTGKELVANAIHEASARRDKPYYRVNCAALSAGLLESELFGHERGAFTGAERQRKGRFELADGGTILLDEVSEIGPELQAKLLRVLQEKEFERVGSSDTIRVDVKVLATTNRDLRKAVETGDFREDLYFRLNVLSVEVPPLRERLEDVPELAHHFVERFRREMGRAKILVHPEAIRVLESHRWPGNIRELQNLIERAVVLTDRDEIGAGDLTLPTSVTPEADPLAQVAAGVTSVPAPTPVVPSAAVAAAAVAAVGTERGRDLGDLVRTSPLVSVDEIEKLLIEETLRRFRGHQERSARSLGIGVRTLRTKIKRWGLHRRGEEET